MILRENINKLWYNLFMFFLKKKWILITHSGDYHLDDVFSTAALKILAEKENARIKIIRTRDKKIFAKYREEREKGKKVFIFDVGGKFIKEKDEFDHHQKGGAKTRKNGIEYSSAGLVWEKYGEEICDSKEIAGKIDKNIVMAIDALDNGQEIYEKKYDFSSLSASDIIRSFFPLNEKTDKKMLRAFKKSVELIKEVLEKRILLENKRILDAKIIKKIYKKTKDKRYLVIPENVSTNSIDNENYPEVLFLIKKKDEGKIWILNTVPIEKNSFVSKKKFPKKWAALEGEELDKVTGLKGGIFCHRARFIASADNFSTAEKMIKKALGE